jgi:hypothetical protein
MEQQQAGVESAEPEAASVTAVSGARPARPGPGRAAMVNRLQRAAGNAAVAALLAREPDTKAPPAGQPTPDPAAPGAAQPPPVMPATSPPRKNYVFLMGDIKNDAFYTAANVFFKQHHPGAQFYADKRTLAEVIQTVNAGGVPVLQLFIVSHANEAGNLGFSLDAADLAKDRKAGDQKPRTEFKEVKEANAAHSLPAADVKIIDDFTKVEIKGCNIGRSQLMLEELDTAFGGHAQVIAPTHKQEYSFKGNKRGVVSEEALYQYSVEEPGSPPDPTPAELLARFVAKYPAVPADRWKAYMKKVKKNHSKKAAYVHTQPNPPADDAGVVIKLLHASSKWPKDQGWALTYKGRTVIATPKGPAYSYEVVAERVTDAGSTIESLTMTAPVPPEKDVLKAQEEANSGRPGAYTWSVEDEFPGGNLVRTVYSERTEWTIDEKVVDAAGTAQPAETDPTFYGRSTVGPPAPAAPAATP